MALFAGFYDVTAGIVNVLLIGIALFLILLVLVQRGRGGGLAGAFGGPGGQSAFGSKAGDAFTRVTIYVAAAWILLLMIEIKLVRADVDPRRPKDQQSQVGGTPQGDAQ
jgi:preprotein translocase subunit SecG